jgi:hypothetical protein
MASAYFRREEPRNIFELQLILRPLWCQCSDSAPSHRGIAPFEQEGYVEELSIADVFGFSRPVNLGKVCIQRDPMASR